LDHGIVFNLDPTILELGPFELRYYGIIFASMLYAGFSVWHHQMVRAGHSAEISEKYLIWGVIAVLAGSRLGHCFFYEPERFLADPITILYFWKGGLASHGATIGLILSAILYAWKYKFPTLEIMDNLAMPAAIAAAAVRLGNFFNSEIVGRATDLPWAVRFPIHDCHSEYLCRAAIPRHPSQLYEFTWGLFVLLVLYLTDRYNGKEKRPHGLMCGVFLALYFTGRFFLEYVKEFQVDKFIENQSAFTMGQYLSIIPVILGLCLITWSKRKGAKTNP
jgi:phosphatidylglycerol:prolipoprotein diacylglycerol transferase